MAFVSHLEQLWAHVVGRAHHDFWQSSLPWLHDLRYAEVANLSVVRSIYLERHVASRSGSAYLDEVLFPAKDVVGLDVAVHNSLPSSRSQHKRARHWSEHHVQYLAVDVMQSKHQLHNETHDFLFRQERPLAGGQTRLQISTGAELHDNMNRGVAVSVALVVSDNVGMGQRRQHVDFVLRLPVTKLSATRGMPELAVDQKPDAHFSLVFFGHARTVHDLDDHQFIILPHMSLVMVCY